MTVEVKDGSIRIDVERMEEGGEVSIALGNERIVVRKGRNGVDVSREVK